MFFTEFTELYYSQKIAALEPTISCVRGRDATTVLRTQLTEKTVKLIIIHVSVDSLNSLNSVNSVQSRENPIVILGCKFQFFSCP